jgi:hypothetical protein
MSDARYVLAGMARPRATWFPDVSRWANAGAIPAEFVKCVGPEDLLARVRSGRSFSAVLIDGGLPGIDRDLLSQAGSTGALVVVVRDPRITVDWEQAGADAVLDANFGPGKLLDLLAGTARLIPRTNTEDPSLYTESGDSPIRGHVITIVGGGGVGTSTVAMAVAQAAGADGYYGNIVLADFCLRAELAMLHDTQVVTPGVQELVDAHRTSTLDADQLRQLCFAINGRNYDLLLGLRRRRFWTAIRPTAAATAFKNLSTCYGVVVVDADAEFDGESETGSMDMEERNVLARTAAQGADTVLAVGHASLKGLHTLTRVIGDLRDFGVTDATIQPIINQAPNSPKARAAYSAALYELLGGSGTQTATAPPLFLPFAQVDEAVRAVAPLPSALSDPLQAFLAARINSPLAPKASRTPWQRMRTGFLKTNQEVAS